MSELLIRLFIRNPGNPEDGAVRESYGRLTGIVGIVCNMLLCVSKLIIGTLSGSVSITADAVNNLSDASSSIVTLVGFRLAARPADKEHPYGHARIEYFAGLAVAVLILVIGIELLKTSFTKVLHPADVEFSYALIVVLVLSVLIKLWMAAFYRKVGKKIDSGTLEAAAADSRNDVVTTTVVLISCIVGKLTGLRLDGWMGLAVALFILYSGVSIIKDTLDPLIGAAPDPTLRDEIAGQLTSHEAILGIHDLMIHDYGPGRQFATVHAEMDCQEDPLKCHEILDDIERACAEKYHVNLTIHYDPIVTDDAVLNRMRKKVLAAVHGIDPRLSIHDFRMVRGSSHTNLIFDLVVPRDFPKTPGELKEQIDREVQFDETMRYYTVIQFDSDSFNKLDVPDQQPDR